MVVHRPRDFGMRLVEDPAHRGGRLRHGRLGLGGPAGRHQRVAVVAQSIGRFEMDVAEAPADEFQRPLLPRDRFAALAPELDRARGQVIEGALGQMLAEYLRLLERSLPTLGQDDRRGLGDAIQAMVAACVAPTAARLSEAGGQLDLTRLERVRQAIRQRLHSARLTPASLCRDVGMSRSQLYRLLEGEGGTDAGHWVYAAYDLNAALGADGYPSYETAMAKLRAQPMNVPVSLPADGLPILVTFGDITDPTSVQRVDPTDLAASFGPSVDLKAVTLEITDEPVTMGQIERLPFWSDLERQVTFSGKQFYDASAPDALNYFTFKTLKRE